MSLVEQLPKNLKIVRSAAKLTQRALGNAMGLSRDTIARLETGTQRVNVEHLEGYARHCRISLASLVAPTPDSSSSKFIYYMPMGLRKKLTTHIKTEFEKWYQRYLLLDRKLFTAPQPGLPQINPAFESASDTREMAEDLARHIRSYWGLGDTVIDNPVQLLEAQGIFVTGRNLGSGAIDYIAGKIIGNERYGIMVNTNPDRPIEQQQFKLVEALSLLLCCGNGDQVASDLVRTNRSIKQMDIFANHFALSFLVPSQPLKKILNRFRNKPTITPSLISFLNNYFQVSSRTIFQRLMDLGHIDRKTFLWLTDRIENEAVGRVLIEEQAPLVFAREWALEKISQELQISSDDDKWEDRLEPTHHKRAPIIKTTGRLVNSPEMKRFIKKHNHFWWWVPEDKKENLNPDSVVEALLNYGEIKDIIELFELLGIKQVAKIFTRQVAGGRPNYKPQTINFYKLYFKRHA